MICVSFGHITLCLAYSAQYPLVGGEAPDFTAEAVYDQEFQTVTLSQYRVRILDMMQCLQHALSQSDLRGTM